ncbi:hypothetical protein DTO013E5_9999 [Penicillium roqueforti]|nr:hypothetical protein CBS147337_10284 [Penicillium roqueforti]KAI2669509.1 hypothetical protein CBS147355_9797 [Penicillium roqueforti]KAI2684327.1 hypothetical protein LCP963914a_5627 [Penicillium roqueforti]KAI2694683.1 hypothetical protein CBS147372_9650 [Penicillium roqueforti]KAI2707838.1 hypothetical protein CBS147318_9750 [Penicillium roqueforti]
MSGIHLLNFSSFLAKLAFTCVCKDRMCQVALVLFRRTFEERQVLRSSGDPGDPDDEDPHRSMDSLEIRHLLPSATAWLREADCNILQLSEEAAKEANEKTLEESATDAIHAMVRVAEKRNSDILRVYQTAGDLIYKDENFLPLKKIVEGKYPWREETEDGEETEDHERGEDSGESKMPEVSEKEEENANGN